MHIRKVVCAASMRAQVYLHNEYLLLVCMENELVGLTKLQFSVVVFCVGVMSAE